MVVMELNQTHLHVAIYPVGLESRVQEVNKLLNIGSDDTRVIGICGMGGVGKTTIAKAVYNQLFHSFDGKSFLGNVREMSMQHNGLVILQEQLLFGILRKRMQIHFVDRGINVIQERLSNIRVLIVIDDVKDVNQINALAGQRDWFGLGSRIIITSRDVHLLKQMEVDAIYKVEELDDSESLCLLSWHAFKESHPPEAFIQLSKDVSGYCKGLPLALEVLGSFLFRRSINEWNNALEKLRKIPPDKVLAKLRISFDALDHLEKDIFLDIAFYFDGVRRDYVIKILDACNLFATVGITVLASRCLLKFTVLDKLMMHDLLRDMAKAIVCEESPKALGRRNRLWFREDVLKVLTKNEGSEEIEGLVLKMPRSNAIHLQAESFTRMERLRLLQLDYVYVSGNFESFSHELRWLCWHGFPLESLPVEFYQKNLVSIDLRYSNLSQVWKDRKVLERLKFLNLSHSHYLIETPDFSLLPNLEIVKLKDCKSLDHIHESIGNLNKLIKLTVEDCKCLKSLAISIVKLESLEILNLSGCVKIKRLPEDIGKMKSLERLRLNKTAIRQLPLSIACLEKLRYLSLDGCKGLSQTSFSSLLPSWLSSRRNLNYSNGLLPNSVNGWCSLSMLSIRNCHIPEHELPYDLWQLPSLIDLDLEGNDFQTLPATLSLSKLIYLRMDHCTKLKSLPELPKTLRSFSAQECRALECFPNISDSYTPQLFLGNCQNLVEIPGMEIAHKLHLHGCNNLSQSFIKTLLQKWSPNTMAEVFLPGKEIPDMFSYQGTGSSLSFQVIPQTRDSTLKGFSVCIVYVSNINRSASDGSFSGATAFPTRTHIRSRIVNNAKNLDRTYESWTDYTPIPFQDHIWVRYYPVYLFGNQWDIGDQVEVSVDFREGISVKKLGVKLVFNQQSVLHA